MTDTLTAPDFAELRRLNEWVQTQPQDWDQATYVNECGTAFCVAGKTLVDAGHTLQHGHEGTGGYWGLLLDGKFQRFGIGVERAAAERLSIDLGTAEVLFGAGNSAADIDRIIRDIFAEHGVEYDAEAPCIGCGLTGDCAPGCTAMYWEEFGAELDR